MLFARTAPAALRALLLTGVLALGLAGCGGDDPPGGEGVEAPEPVRTLVAASDPVLGPYLEVAGEFYGEETRTDVRVRQIDGEDALAQLCEGEIAVAGAAREPQGCETDLERVTVAHHGVAVVASRDAAADCLTIGELRELWRPVGKRGGDRSLAGPRPGTTTYEFFAASVVGEGGALRGDYFRTADRLVFAERLDETDAGLGFWNFGDIQWAVPQRLKLVAVDAGEGCVRPSNATVRSGRYPLSRPLFVYARSEDLRPDTLVTRFVRFALVNYRQFGEVSDTVVPLRKADAERQLDGLPPADVPAG